jgi:hypothetical protein
MWVKSRALHARLDGLGESLGTPNAEHELFGGAKHGDPFLNRGRHDLRRIPALEPPFGTNSRLFIRFLATRPVSQDDIYVPEIAVPFLKGRR